MSSSGTYNFSSPQIRELIDEAYERVGILATEITGQKISTAIRSLNFILQEWVSKGNNLWTVKEGMLGLVANKNSYLFLNNLIDIKTAAIRTSNRVLGGTPFSSAGGSATNCFDGNYGTACSQLSADGYISYDWGGSRNAISMVGIQSNINTQYTLSFDYSNDGINWITAFETDTVEYNTGDLIWFSIPAPTPYSYFRVKEIDSGSDVQFWDGLDYASWEEFLTNSWDTWGDTVPLNLQEVYFNSNLYDTVVTRISEQEYTSLPNKNQTGRPTSFWVDRQINPIIHLWPAPNSQYNNLYFTYWEAIQDAGTMLDSANVPARFIEPLCAALAYRLAIKVGSPNMQMLGELAEKAYNTAAMEDRERVPLRIYGDYTQGWSSV